MEDHIQHNLFTRKNF